MQRFLASHVIQSYVMPSTPQTRTRSARLQSTFLSEYRCDEYSYEEEHSCVEKYEKSSGTGPVPGGSV